MRPQGLITIAGVTDASGKRISTQQAVDYGWVNPAPGQCRGWGLAKHEIPLGNNLFLDNGRQMLCYAFAYRSPIENFVCRRFGVGTGTTAANVADVALQAPITLASTGLATAPIDSIDFLSAFVLRVAFTLAIGDANGNAISEMGLFTGSYAILARKVRTAVINKTSDASYSLLWRMRL